MKGKFSSLTALTVLAVLVQAPPVLAQKSPAGGGGAKVTSGVVAVLGFDSGWWQEVPTLSSTVVVPTVCQTAAHVAGPSEVAIASMTAFFAPSGQSNDFLQLFPAMSTNGSLFAAVGNTTGIDGLADGAGQASVNKKIPLTEGTTYVFGAAFRAGGPVINAFSWCDGTVTIVRIP
jgi:hypothetical protein